ncbi:hypothetical protein A1O3_07786 [Capronia epimyces CBS 606.96]|uniref:Heterokaryon incompatibility domain-containing protein n=1 Tax=Capronia epimyces CBS 606.96 TaxID=1182542 RepID=W9XMR1_9EURO|nr:uncharacterized protein A1O3_07786 [Capronia epimyces CBS 606.96]EXJ81493.1 hypothetical protein A1O3_07786 [Capronia epimyces CBS 606.96]
MAAVLGPCPDDPDAGITHTTTAEARFAEGRARRELISQIIRANYIGPQRSLLGSLNEFRHWSPQEVRNLFEQNLPPIKEGDAEGRRKLYPLGPLYRSIPSDSRRWKDLATKAAMVGVVDAFAVPFSPLLLLASKEQRKKTMQIYADLNVSAISSSFFVKASPGLLEQAAQSGKALCVNRWGIFRIMDSGYAAISHVWVETMGLEYNDEKTEQDERGFNMHHFIRIMDVVRRTGCEWVWFDLLAIPKGRDPASRALKTRLINSLRHVYANAARIVVLDGLTLQLNSGDPLITAAILSCGRWLSRVWTYQEAKLARELKIVTATAVIDLKDMVGALRAAELRDYNRWHQLYLTFARLMPLHEQGISLADIALSCGNRSCENEIDYARGFFAVLGLEWKQDFTYEDGMLAILQSQPQHAASIAGMHGPRGLPSPYSWAPKYLARLQGRIYDGFDVQLGTLIGYWHTVTVKQLKKRFVPESFPGVVCDLVVADNPDAPMEARAEAEIQIRFYPEHWTDQLEAWLEEAIPSGKARLLCGEHMNVDPCESDQYARIVLAAISTVGAVADLNLDDWGAVAGSAVVNCPSIGAVRDTKMRWLFLD